MIKDALQYVTSLFAGNVKPQEINGRTWTAVSLKPVPENAIAQAFTVTSLTGVIDYLNKQKEHKKPLFVHVVSPTVIEVFSELNGDAERSHFIHANAIVPPFQWGNFMDQEDMIIKLQSGFIPNDHSGLLLSIVGNLTDDEVTQWNDDGVSQSAIVKASVSSSANIPVPPRVMLAPFRTFLEVEQPESEFIFRLKKSHSGPPRAALFEADGGAWKVEAINKIRKYLADEITDNMIADVTIIA